MLLIELSKNAVVEQFYRLSPYTIEQQGQI